jgi:hypothetical protein
VAIDTARISVALVTELALVASLANTFIWVPAIQELNTDIYLVVQSVHLPY